jgi:hypothetical protein
MKTEEFIARLIPIIEQLWHVFHVLRSRQRLHFAQRLESRAPSIAEQSNTGLSMLQQELEKFF